MLDHSHLKCLNKVSSINVDHIQQINFIPQLLEVLLIHQFEVF